LKLSRWRMGGADAAVGDGPLFALLGEVLPGRAFEEGHDLRDLGEDAVGRVVGLVHPHALHDLGDDDAVGFGAFEGGDDGIDALDAALAVGEGAALLEEAGGGQDDVGELAVGVMKSSCTTRKSRALSAALRTCSVLGSVWATSSPMIQRALRWPARAASYICGIL
jgi:hypothetical protein